MTLVLLSFIVVNIIIIISTGSATISGHHNHVHHFFVMWIHFVNEVGSSLSIIIRKPRIEKAIKRIYKSQGLEGRCGCNTKSEWSFIPLLKFLGVETFVFNTLGRPSVNTNSKWWLLEIPLTAFDKD